MTTFKNIIISMFLMIGIVFSNSLELTNLDTTNFITIGIEKELDYCELAKTRLAQQRLEI